MRTCLVTSDVPSRTHDRSRQRQQQQQQHGPVQCAPPDVWLTEPGTTQTMAGFPLPPRPMISGGETRGASLDSMGER